MVNQSVRNIVVIIGNVVTLGLFFSPAPTFYKIIKKKDVEEFEPYPYLATVLTCACLVFYGMPFVHPNSLLIVTVNAVGLVLEIVYLTIFFIYANKKERKKLGIWLLVDAIFFAAVVLITMLALDESLKRSVIVTGAFYFFAILMYISPLTIVEKVVRTKSVKYMPFWLALATFFDGVCYATYTLLFSFDMFILFCNGVGVISGAVQLILYGYYWCKEDNQIDDDDDDVPIVTAV